MTAAHKHCSYDCSYLKFGVMCQRDQPKGSRGGSAGGPAKEPAGDVLGQGAVSIGFPKVLKFCGVKMCDGSF